MSVSYDVLLSQALCQRLLQQQKTAKEPALGYLFGRVTSSAIQCMGCALDNEGVLLSFGYDLVGVFCVSCSQPEAQVYQLCQPLLLKYQESGKLGSAESVVLVYTSAASPTAVFTRTVSLEMEPPCEPRSVSVLRDLGQGTVTLRARASLLLPFEMNSDPKYLRENMEVACKRLKERLQPDVLAFKLEGCDSLLRRCSPEKTLQDLVDQSGDGGGRRRRFKEAQDVLNLAVLVQSTGDAAVESCGMSCTPVIHYQRKVFRSASVVLPLDVVCAVGLDEPLAEVVDLLARQLANQLDQMACCIARFTRAEQACAPEAFHFFPAECGHWMTVVYPGGVSEDDLGKYRRELHRLLLLPVDRPLFRRANAHAFPEDLAAEPYLRNTHVGLTPPPGGTEVRLVRGQYAYRHYLQDRTDDNGWGCAYRSLQTIVSWYRLQGYTDCPVPTHREIQQALVDVGDKPASFVGSRQWIGSQEVGYCLNRLLQVESRTMFVSSGSELPTKSRELLAHFENHGTPIMIGGGMLAHTILGVAFNDKSGETHYLILDPHYTGGEDLAVIQNKGWCGWKAASFWDQNSFYNLCLPQRPTLI